MTLDPVFGWNRDLPQQSNVRNAVRRVRCTFDGRPDWDNAIIETESGIRFAERDNENPNIIRRQAGETVRGFDLPAAATIEMQMPAGKPSWSKTTGLKLRNLSVGGAPVAARAM